MNNILPIFKANHKEMSEAFKTACSDLFSSITLFNNGILNDKNEFDINLNLFQGDVNINIAMS